MNAESDELTGDRTQDAYLTVTAKTGAQANEFQFAGEQTDPTGLQYLRARYYDTASGTFVSREPLSSGVGYSGHPFGYVDGNPVNLVDPLGLDGNPLSGICNPLASWIGSKVCGRAAGT